MNEKKGMWKDKKKHGEFEREISETTDETERWELL